MILNNNILKMFKVGLRNYGYRQTHVKTKAKRVINNQFVSKFSAIFHVKFDEIRNGNGYYIN